MYLLPRLHHQVLLRIRTFRHLQMTSYSSSIQSGSYVTHPSLYAKSSREELLARIAELERAQARTILSQVKHQESVSLDALSASGSAVASTSTSTLDHPLASASKAAGTTSTTSPAVQHQSRAERKQLLRKTSKSDLGSETANHSDAGDTFFDRYPSRKIALRFCYEGWLYGGLALQNDEPPSGIYLPPSTRSNPTQSLTPGSSNTKDTSNKANPPNNGSTNKALPTVEGVLLDALVASRLIKESDKRDLEKLDFSRCGRTDRGVSAAGQVISLYVRSQVDEIDENGSKRLGWRNAVSASQSDGMDLDTIEDPEERKKIDFKKVKKRNELPYMSLLNRVLPNSIRILGWSPVDESFDSRFSCTHRHYKYFFTAPRHSISSSSSTEAIEVKSQPRRNPGLDVRRMQDAANRLVGEHDFRNLCKVDATKQITNFYRRVTSATISPVDSNSAHIPNPTSESLDGLVDGGIASNGGLESGQHEEDIYVFDLKGSAFLYHQVRHIMAILFLVGSGHEDPSVVDALLNTGYASERPLLDPTTSINNNDGSLPLVSSKPAYEMASDLPLVLWNCQFKEESNLKWQQDELIEGQDLRDSKGYLEMKYENTQLRVKEAISTHFMRAYVETGTSSSSSTSPMEVSPPRKQDKKKEMFEIQLGGGKTARAGKYTRLLMRGRSDPVEVVNERWASGQGKRRAERKAREEERDQSEMV